MLSVVMMNVVMLSIISLGVVAPGKLKGKTTRFVKKKNNIFFIKTADLGPML
jgi:hypothetical protein